MSYLTNDHLGSARINTDQNGNVMARHDYQPFGEEIQRASYGADTNRKQFTAYERDKETDLNFAQARYQNSNFGRFISPDPLNIIFEKEKGRNYRAKQMILRSFLAQSGNWNQYSYVLNNPLKLTDPKGLYPVYFRKNDDGSITYRNYHTKGDGFSRYRGGTDEFSNGGYNWRVTSTSMTITGRTQPPPQPITDAPKPPLRTGVDYASESELDGGGGGNEGSVGAGGGAGGGPPMETPCLDCTGLAEAQAAADPGGNVTGVVQQDPITGGRFGWMNTPAELYPNYGRTDWYYHDVYIKNGCVWDPMSRYGENYVPLNEWLDYWDPEIPTHLLLH